MNYVISLLMCLLLTLFSYASGTKDLQLLIVSDINCAVFLLVAYFLGKKMTQTITQTITNCNIMPVGKTYPVADLRSAPDVETLFKYVDAGHPIAYFGANPYKIEFEEATPTEVICASARLLRLQFVPWRYYQTKHYCFDYWLNNVWENKTINEEYLLGTIKLAPLAYKDGRPLHVGDELVSDSGYLYKIQTTKQQVEKIHEILGSEWRLDNQLEAV